MTRKDMARLLLLPLLFCFLTSSTINCAPQFFGRLKPFYSFQNFRVQSQDERDSENDINVNAKAPKPSSDSLRIEPVSLPTEKTTTSPPPTTTSLGTTIKPTPDVVLITVVEDVNKTEADGVDDGPQHDTMNIVDFA